MYQAFITCYNYPAVLKGCTGANSPYCLPLLSSGPDIEGINEWCRITRVGAPECLSGCMN